MVRLALLAACGAAFVWITSLGLPDVVASHFGGGGGANGFMSRGTYVGVMLLVVAGAPTLLGAVSHFGIGSVNSRINLPSRAYWLAPERRAETVSYLQRHLVNVGTALIVFLCYVHWLVVRANRLQPPRLSSSAITVGLAAFLMFALVSGVRLGWHFRRPPGSES
ncbi:MAG: hypothetical protein JO133_12210 [Burkholderiaceae bacterium]|nr:hypothetical protein [Burkholderiaceae bacterium]